MRRCFRFSLSTDSWLEYTLYGRPAVVSFHYTHTTLSACTCKKNGKSKKRNSIRRKGIVVGTMSGCWREKKIDANYYKKVTNRLDCLAAIRWHFSASYRWYLYLYCQHMNLPKRLLWRWINLWLIQTDRKHKVWRNSLDVASSSTIMHHN